MIILPDESLADAGYEAQSIEIPDFDMELRVYMLTGNRGCKIPEGPKREVLREVIRRLIALKS